MTKDITIIDGMGWDVFICLIDFEKKYSVTQQQHNWFDIWLNNKFLFYNVFNTPLISIVMIPYDASLGKAVTQNNVF